MTTELTNALGYIAALLTTSAFVPQILHTLRTRDVSGISLGMYFTLIAGLIAWTLYGCALHAWPVIVANAVTLALALVVLALKLKHKKEARRS